MKTPLLASLILLLPLTAAAQNNEVSVFLGGAAFEETTVIAFFPEDLELSLSFENGRSFAINYNHFWRDSFSTEFGILALATDPTLNFSTTGIDASFDIGDIGVGALTATAQYHFRREARVSPYLGFGVAVLSGEIETEFDDEFGEVTETTADFETAGAVLFNGGVNIRINERWIFGIDVKAIPYSPEAEGEPPVEIPEEEIFVTDELDLNPVIVGFGLRYRF